jgi:FkbM family methyltransferase
MNIIETTDVWSVLAESQANGLPICLYGMGDGADKILQVLSRKGITFSGVYASDEFVRGQSFHGFRVMKLREAEGKFAQFVSVLAFGSNRTDVIEHIKTVAESRVLIAPDVAVCGFTPEKLFDISFFHEHESEFQKAYELFADERSKRLFTDIINFKLSGKIDYLLQNTDTLTEIFGSLPITKEEVCVDAGAYDGDSITAFLTAVDGNYKHIHAFEPSAKVFKRLTKNYGGRDNVTLTNAAAWSESAILSFNDSGNRNAALQTDSRQNTNGQYVPAVSIAETVSCATLVKLDVEGAEAEALEGLLPLVKRGVKLVCAVYHRNEDLYKIPLLLKAQNPAYRFKLRRINCLPAWDIFLCAYIE